MKLWLSIFVAALEGSKISTFILLQFIVNCNILIGDLYIFVPFVDFLTERICRRHKVNRILLKILVVLVQSHNYCVIL